MRKLIVVVVLVAVSVAAREAHAQAVRPFAGAAVATEMNAHRFPTFGGGVVVDLPGSWFSAGAQGEVLVSWPYFGGRGAVFGQVRIAGRRTITPLALAGYGFGEADGPMFGGGVEIRSPGSRFGLRVTIEDYLARVGGLDCAWAGQSFCDEYPNGGRPYTVHQPSLRMAFLF